MSLPFRKLRFGSGVRNVTTLFKYNIRLGCVYYFVCQIPFLFTGNSLTYRVANHEAGFYDRSVSRESNEHFLPFGYYLWRIFSTTIRSSQSAFAAGAVVNLHFVVRAMTVSVLEIEFYEIQFQRLWTKISYDISTGSEYTTSTITSCYVNTRLI